MVKLKPSALSEEVLRNNENTPLFICTDSPRIFRKLSDAGYKEIRINMSLSKALLKFPIGERPLQIEAEFAKLIRFDTPVLITNFEMLFDPRYKLDVIKLFCDKARILNVAVKWPGKISENKLTYAEPGYPDFHEYNCDSYQIRVVQ